MADAVKVCVTGAAGQIAYSLLYSVASGEVFGRDQPLILTLLDITPMMGVLHGVVMEMQDCALPLVKEVIATDKADEAFTDIDVAFLVGAMPRREGMERKDLLKANVKIFMAQGKALDVHAKKSVKVLVVGNPANTNALIASQFAPSIPKPNFTCMTRLDQNRAQAQIAHRLGVSTKDVNNIIIWGNHSSTQFPDVDHATVNLNGIRMPIKEAVKDDNYLKGEFIKVVQTRGAEVIKARKLSSAMSAAKAICDHMRDWWFGSGERWVSMGIVSSGQYGIPQDIVYSFPVRITPDRNFKVIEDLEVSDFARQKMDATAKELVDERDVALSTCEN